MQSFIEKIAVSPALMQRVLAGRAAQGVGGAAALGRQVAGAAAQGATTSRQVMGQLGGLGKHRLQGVAQGGTAARQTQQAFGGAKAGLQGRIQGAEHMQGKLDFSRPLKTHEGYMGAEHAYSPAYANAIARPQGVLQDPKGLMQATQRSPALHTATPAMGASNGGGVTVTSPTIPAAGMPAASGTQSTVVARRRR